MPNAADRTLMAACGAVQTCLSFQTITYVPKGGVSRQIAALVDYPGPGPIGPTKDGSRPYAEITVCNAPSGILSTQVDTGGDKVILPMRIGLPATTLRIVEIIDQDEAMLRLQCY